ncbi:hypothetical protein [Wolbachia endosymbiont (group A) of Cydia strobilella]
MRYLLSEERCNKAIPVSSTGMTPLGTAVIKEPVSATFMASIIDLDLPSN